MKISCSMYEIWDKAEFCNEYCIDLYFTITRNVFASLNVGLFRACFTGSSPKSSKDAEESPSDSEYICEPLLLL